ncbi:MAG: hypothetical protein L0H15_03140 [Nitrosospira sp.]|nr:hypothetical protein [Nitrosospira sp.]MDN5935466.1 hypothetical protein [Nitrosospira sp.]
MKFSSKSANRSLALALVIGSTLGLGTAGITHAQYGTSGQGSTTGQGGSSGQAGSTGQGSSAGQGSTPKSSEKYPYGILEEKIDTGQVDQKIRVERNKSKEPVLPPPVRKNEKGLVVEDPSQIQGGSIGPN